MAQPISTTSGVSIPISSIQSTSSTDHTYSLSATSSTQPSLSIQERDLSTHQTFGFFTPPQPDERNDPRLSLSCDPEDINIATAAPDDIFGETHLMPFFPAQQQSQPDTTQSIQTFPESRGASFDLPRFKLPGVQQVPKPHSYRRKSSSAHPERTRKKAHTVSKAPDQKAESTPTQPAAKAKPRTVPRKKTSVSSQPHSLRLATQLAVKESLLTRKPKEQPSPQSAQEVSSAPSTSSAGRQVTKGTSKKAPESQARSLHLKTAKVKKTIPFKTSPMLDFIIEELQKNELLHWKHNITAGDPVLNTLNFSKSILDTMENGTFIKKRENNYALALRWSLYSRRQLEHESKRIACDNFTRAFRYQYQYGTIEHITQTDPEKPNYTHSPVFKINIDHPQVKQYLQNHNVTFP